MIVTPTNSKGGVQEDGAAGPRGGAQRRREGGANQGGSGRTSSRDGSYDQDVDGSFSDRRRGFQSVVEPDGAGMALQMAARGGTGRAGGARVEEVKLSETPLPPGVVASIPVEELEAADRQAQNDLDTPREVGGGGGTVKTGIDQQPVVSLPIPTGFSAAVNIEGDHARGKLFSSTDDLTSDDALKQKLLGQKVAKKLMAKVVEKRRVKMAGTSPGGSSAPATETAPARPGTTGGPAKKAPSALSSLKGAAKLKAAAKAVLAAKAASTAVAPDSTGSKELSSGASSKEPRSSRETSATAVVPKRATLVAPKMKAVGNRLAVPRARSPLPGGSREGSAAGSAAGSRQGSRQGSRRGSIEATGSIAGSVASQRSATGVAGGRTASKTKAVVAGSSRTAAGTGTAAKRVASPKQTGGSAATGAARGSLFYSEMVSSTNARPRERGSAPRSLRVTKRDISSERREKRSPGREGHGSSQKSLKAAAVELLTASPEAQESSVVVVLPSPKLHLPSEGAMRPTTSKDRRVVGPQSKQQANSRAPVPKITMFIPAVTNAPDGTRATESSDTTLSPTSPPATVPETTPRKSAPVVAPPVVSTKARTRLASNKKPRKITEMVKKVVVEKVGGSAGEKGGGEKKLVPVREIFVPPTPEDDRINAQLIPELQHHSPPVSPRGQTRRQESSRGSSLQDSPVVHARRVDMVLTPRSTLEEDPGDEMVSESALLWENNIIVSEPSSLLVESPTRQNRESSPAPHFGKTISFSSPPEEFVGGEPPHEDSTVGPAGSSPAMDTPTRAVRQRTFERQLLGGEEVVGHGSGAGLVDDQTTAIMVEELVVADVDDDALFRSLDSLGTDEFASPAGPGVQGNALFCGAASRSTSVNSFASARSVRTDSRGARTDSRGSAAAVATSNKSSKGSKLVPAGGPPKGGSVATAKEDKAVAGKRGTSGGSLQGGRSRGSAARK